MSSSRAMQRLCGLMRKAVQDYEMIAPGDKVMVGVSGGKDSVPLPSALPNCASTSALILRCRPSRWTRSSAAGPWIIPYCRSCLPSTISPMRSAAPRSALWCSTTARRRTLRLCAKLRRGALHTAAQELGCNKVALGHHLDDAVETFYMNLWREGRIGCFSPVTYFRAGTSPSSGPCCWPPSRRSFPQ